MSRLVGFIVFLPQYGRCCVPDDWLKGVIIILGKKGNTSICKNNRGSHCVLLASELFETFVFKRIDQGLETLLRDLESM